MANFIRPLPIECLGYTSWPLRSSKEIPLFNIKDVTERTCSDFFHLFGNGTHTGSIGKNFVIFPPIGKRWNL